jgi:hypothetical protein
MASVSGFLRYSPRCCQGASTVEEQLTAKRRTAAGVLPDGEHDRDRVEMNTRCGIAYINVFCLSYSIGAYDRVRPMPLGFGWRHPPWARCPFPHFARCCIGESCRENQTLRLLLGVYMGRRATAAM